MALTAAQAARVMGANDRIQAAIIGLGGRGHRQCEAGEQAGAAYAYGSHGSPLVVGLRG